MSQGIILSRGLLAQPIYRDERAMRLLIHLMLLALEAESLAPANNTSRLGSVRISQRDIATSLRWSRASVKRAIDRLRLADAIVVTPHGSKSDEIICLHYKPAMAETPKPIKEKRASTPEPQRPLEARRDEFIGKCEVVYAATPERLPLHLRGEFVAYWTEPNSKGQMRFEVEPFFEHGRRMDTWRRRAEVPLSSQRDQKPQTDRNGGTWNPRG